MKNINTDYNRDAICQTVNYLLGENAIASFPVPDCERDLMIEKHFVYFVTFGAKSRRPVATLTSEMNGGMILEFTNCHFKDYMDTPQYPFSDTPDYIVKGISVDELNTYNEELFDCYEIVRRIVFQKSITKKEEQAVLKYKELFKRLVPTSLLPYYISLGKSFFEWLDLMN